MQYTYKKTFLLLCYAHLMGGTHIQPLFAAQQKSDAQLITDQSQHPTIYCSGASMHHQNEAAKYMLPEVDDNIEKNIMQKQSVANEDNTWGSSMLEWTVNEESDMYNTKKKAIDNKYKKDMEALQKKHAAIDQQIEEKSKQDYEEFLASKKKNEELKKAKRLAKKEKREKKARQAEREKKELQRKINAIKKPKYQSRDRNMSRDSYRQEIQEEESRGIISRVCDPCIIQ